MADLQAAHDAVGAAADGDPDRTGMATTAVVATLAGGTARVAHVGDSRAYLRDGDGRLEQVTRDHGMGGYITQALGLDRGVDPDVVELATPPASRLLLCSDGLSNMVDAADIGALLGCGGRGGRLRRAGRGRSGPRRHRQRDRGRRDLLTRRSTSRRPAAPRSGGRR